MKLEVVSPFLPASIRNLEFQNRQHHFWDANEEPIEYKQELQTFSRNIRGTHSLHWYNETDAPASFMTTKITFCTVQVKSENNNTKFPVFTAQLRY